MKSIAVEEEADLIPLNLGIVSSYYYINTATLELFSDNIKEDSKLKHLIEILSNGTEFDSIPIRHGEVPTLRALSQEISYTVDKPNYNEP